MDLPKRKQMRLKGYDYSQQGAYFITMCTNNRQCLFGNIVRCGVPDTLKQMQYSLVGNMVDTVIQNISEKDNNITIDKYIIMPNHIHFILFILSGNGTSRMPSPTNAIIPKFVSSIKRFTDKQCSIEIWQRSYHDHIIRNERDYQEIWNYIDENIKKWEEDKFYEPT